MHRRQFLTVAAGTLACLAGGSAFALSATQGTSGLEPKELLGMLGPDVVREIGKQYRAAVPREKTATALRATLLKGLTDRTLWAHRILDDFAAGRTIIVSGWVLSVTEARQCALFSIVSPA